MTIEELARQIAERYGREALTDWAGLGEEMEEHGLGEHEIEALAELVKAELDRAWGRRDS